jgi:hypothetical protein
MFDAAPRAKRGDEKQTLGKFPRKLKKLLRS